MFSPRRSVNSTSPVCWFTLRTLRPPIFLQNTLISKVHRESNVKEELSGLRLSRLCSPLSHIYRGAVKQPSPRNRIQAASLATLTNVELCSRHATHAADRSPFNFSVTRRCLPQTGSFPVADEENFAVAVTAGLTGRFPKSFRSQPTIYSAVILHMHGINEAFTGHL